MHSHHSVAFAVRHYQQRNFVQEIKTEVKNTIAITDAENVFIAISPNILSVIVRRAKWISRTDKNQMKQMEVLLLVNCQLDVLLMRVQSCFRMSGCETKQAERNVVVRENRLYRLMFKVMPPKVAVSNSVVQESLQVWHERLGHQN